MSEASESKPPKVQLQGSSEHAASPNKTVWRSQIGGIPGVKRLYRQYANIREQYLFLARIARETYGRPEPLFDDYQADYSHNMTAEQERYELILSAVEQSGGPWGDAIEIGC